MADPVSFTVEFVPYEARALIRACGVLLELCHKDVAEFHQEVGVHPLERLMMKLETALVSEGERL